MAENTKLVIADFQRAASIVERCISVSNLVDKLPSAEGWPGNNGRKIRCQSGIVHDALLKALVPYTGTRTALQMLSTTDHEMWRNNDFGHYIQHSWNANARDLKDCVSSIDMLLDLVTPDPGSPNEKYSQVLTQHLQDLKENIKDLKLLLKQCIPRRSDQEMSSKLLETKLSSTYAFGGNLTFHAPVYLGNKFNAQGSINFGDLTKPHESQAKIEIRRFQRIQEAATQLYRAFGHACNEHYTHHARLKLLASCDHVSQIHFTLIMQHSGLLTTSGGEGRQGLPMSLLLRIESQLTGTISKSLSPPDDSRLGHILDVPPQHLKRKRDGSDGPQPPLLKRNVRTQQEPSRHESDAASHRCRYVDNGPLSPKQPRPHRKTVAFADVGMVFPAHKEANYRVMDSSTLPNFCNQNDLCRYIDVTFGGLPGREDHQALGYLLDCPGSLRHSIYLSSDVHQSNSRTTRSGRSWDRLPGLPSLKQLTRSRSREGTLSMVDWVMIEKQLATAVLQFHATPWLEKSWDSDHVLVRKETTSQTTRGNSANVNTSQWTNDYESYLEVVIEKDDISKSKQPLQKSTLIRNPTLFRLGVMLLESAYGRSLRELQKPRDKDPYGDNNTEYYTAQRLLENVSDKVGLVRAEIIRRCINFSSELGFDLQSNESQERYYNDVIERLDFVEQRFRDLGL